MSTEIDVQVGQVWADNDPRVAGRTIKVEAIDGNKAVCRVLATPFDYPQGRTGHTTKIALRRFKPTTTGYRLIREADGTQIEALG